MVKVVDFSALPLLLFVLAVSTREGLVQNIDAFMDSGKEMVSQHCRVNLPLMTPCPTPCPELWKTRKLKNNTP